MRDRFYYQPDGTSVNSIPYTQVFVQRTHELLGQGYAALNRAEFGCAQEEYITGELVRAVDAVLDDIGAPRWMRSFSIHEEPRIHDMVRRGKRRLRLDIRFDCSQSNPRLRMQFEAKRLGPNHGTSMYLGVEGIKRFLDGRYAHNDRVAGMLGYVQEGSPDDWAVKIERGMNRDAVELSLSKSGCWCRQQLTSKLSSTYRSGHDRPSVGQPIEIFHTFLLFN